MSDRSPFTIIARALQSHILLTRTQPLFSYPLWRCRFRRYALGLLGIAGVFVVCGVEYKLSVYRCHSTSSSRVPIAQLWIESRDASEATVSSSKIKSYQLPGSQAFYIPIRRLPQLSRTAGRILRVRPRDVAYFDFLIPFRSPPPLRFF